MFRQGKMKIQIARVSGVAAVSLAIAFTAGCNRDPNVRKQKYLESGKRYEDSGKYKEAAIQFLNALKVDKNFGDAHYELAQSYLKMGNMTPAYLELMKTVDLSPSNLKARVELGDLLLAARQVDRADAQAKAVLAIDPNYADAYALLAGIAQKKGDSAEAMKDIQHAIAVDPNRAAFHTSAALLDTTTPGNESSAEAELGKAASLDPKNPTPHMVLAQLLDRKGDHDGAEREYTAAAGIAPKDLQARAALAGLYLREGKKDKVEQTLHQAVEDMPDNEQASALLLDFYRQSSQPDRAETVFADLNAKHEKSFAIKVTYAGLLMERREFDKAGAVMKELNKSDGRNPQVLTLNAMLLINTGKVDDAFVLIQKATKDTPNNIQLQLLMARVADAKGDTTVAESSYRAAAKLSPANMEAASGLAEIATQHNNASMLSEVADKTIQLHPDMAQGYLWRGLAEFNRKEFDKAEADFQAVLKINPNSSGAYLELGLLRLSQNHIPEGRAMLEKAVEKDPNSFRALALLVGFDLRAKQPAVALSRVQAVIARSPQNGNLYDELAFVQLQMKDFKTAVDSARKAMQLAPSSTSAALTYTKAEMALGEVDPAISTWEQWIAVHPTDANAYSILGGLEDAKNDQERAVDYYKKALQFDPNNGIAANNLAYLMVDSGQNLDVALTLAQTARRQMPDEPETADTLAWTYYHKENYLGAKGLLEEALKTVPDNATMQLHLGMTDSKLNDKPNAVLHLKKAVSLALPNSKTAMDANEELEHLK
jgi:tetratricopeptide (TPR) repeat protein